MSTSEQLSPGLLSYLTEIFTVLRLQGFALSVSGLSGARSKLGVLQQLSADTIRLLTLDNNAIYRPRIDGEEVEAYFLAVRQRLEQGELTAPAVSLTTRQRDRLTRLRVVYHWGEEVANNRGEQLFSLAEMETGQAVGIVSQMLDPLVDQAEVERRWTQIKDSPTKLEGFIKHLQFEIGDELYPIHLGGVDN